MRILFTARNWFPSEGGLQMSTHQLAERLIGNGHEVAVLTAMYAPWSPPMLVARAFRKLSRRPLLLEDRKLGYPTYRCVHGGEGLRLARRRFDPDVLVMNIAGASAVWLNRQVLSESSGLPLVFYLRDVGFVELFADLPRQPQRVIANAQKLVGMAAEFGFETELIPSVIDIDAYLTETTRETVLFINPVATRGLDIAWAVAEANPDIPFVFQQSWPLTRRDLKALRRRAAELGNVEVRRTRHTPSAVYSDAKVLLVPYLVENRPRVIHEAQASGIPVVATGAGGLVEATGAGGVLVPPDAPVSAWNEALRRLWDDDAFYREQSDAAWEHARREEMDPAKLTARFEGILASVVSPVAGTASAGGE